MFVWETHRDRNFIKLRTNSLLLCVSATSPLLFTKYTLLEEEKTRSTLLNCLLSPSLNESLDSGERRRRCLTLMLHLQADHYCFTGTLNWHQASVRRDFLTNDLIHSFSPLFFSVWHKECFVSRSAKSFRGDPWDSLWKESLWKITSSSFLHESVSMKFLSCLSGWVTRDRPRDGFAIWRRGFWFKKLKCVL